MTVPSRPPREVRGFSATAMSATRPPISAGPMERRARARTRSESGGRPAGVWASAVVASADAAASVMSDRDMAGRDEGVRGRRPCARPAHPTRGTRCSLGRAAPVARPLGAQLGQLRLLLLRELILDPHEQADLGALDFALDVEDPVYLLEHLGLVHGRGLEELLELFSLAAQPPLRVHELPLRLLDGVLDGGARAVGEVELLLVRHHEFGREHEARERVVGGASALAGRLRARERRGAGPEAEA